MSRVDELNEEIDAKIQDKLDNQPTTEIATVKVNDFAPPEMLSGFEAKSWSNLPTDKRIRWRMISKATGSNVSAGDEWLNKVFRIKHWFVHTVRFNGEEPGEFVDGIRTVLIDPEGGMIAFGSNGIAESLGLLVECYGNKEYHPAIPVKITSQKTSAGRKIYKLEAADEES